MLRKRDLSGDGEALDFPRDILRGLPVKQIQWKGILKKSLASRS